MTDLLAVEDLSFRVKNKMKGNNVFELGPINFNIQAGETLAIVGANSSGKSLLAKLLVGLEQPDSGVIYLNGQKLHPTNLKHV
jgi:cationic peptide transport system ATP-binding protein